MDGTQPTADTSGLLQSFRPAARRHGGHGKRLAETVKRNASSLASLSDQELRSMSEQVRERLAETRTSPAKNQTPNQSISPVFALAFEAVRRQLGLELHAVQLQAAHGLVTGAAVEMQTGEGKTLSAFPAAVYQAMLGQPVQVATPNQYLAERDCAQLQAAYESLSLTCNFLPEGASSSRPADTQREKTAAYQSDVLFGSGYEFGFDFLRDQMVLLREADLPLGEKYTRRFLGRSVNDQTCTVGQFSAIVDEADHVLIDDADSPLVLSEAPQGPAPDREAILLAKHVAAQLEPGSDFELTTIGNIHLTDAAIHRIHGPEVSIPADQLIRPWTSYVSNALAAQFRFRRDVEYVVEEDEIKLVDQATGRIFEDRTWNEGLHQAIEAKEGLEPTPDSIPMVKMTRQRFFRRYRHLCGMSGTVAGCEAELKRTYELEVLVVPPRLPSRRKILPLRSFGSADAKWEAIGRSAAEMHQTGRPVLIGTNTIADSLVVAQRLSSAGLEFQLLNGCQDGSEAEIIARAGQHGAVTIATNMAGRGTDIRLDERSRQLGGLHVIVSECHFLSRVDRQLVGRAARQGDPGSAQSFLSSEDMLLTKYAPWLAEFISRQAAAGKLTLDFTAQILKIQRSIERERFFARLELGRNG